MKNYIDKTDSRINKNKFLYFFRENTRFTVKNASHKKNVYNCKRS